MADEREALRDWHRLFGLILIDFFTNSPFTVEVERDLSQQQQFLDVVILRRGRGRFAGKLPDGLDGLAEHNLISFKSHHEALDGWAMKELIGHFVAYRKLISPSPSELLPEERFRLYAVCARFPHNLSSQVPWQERQAGVYDCQWGTDVVRVVVAGQLPLEAHNAPLHLFSAAPEMVGFGRSSYQQRSSRTSRILAELCEEFQEEGIFMSFTAEDFDRWYIKKYFPKLTPKEKEEALQALPAKERLAGLSAEERLAGLSPEEIKEYLDQLTANRASQPRRRPRKK